MILSRKQVLIGTCLALYGLSGVAQSNYPNKPLTWIVPYSAGGPTDALARSIADRVGRELGQPILIDNRGGAGGTIGALKGARSSPDGYTFLVGHMGNMGVGPSLYKNLAYDPVKDFTAVFRMPDTPSILVTSKNSPYQTAEDLIDFARKNPGRINCGNAGVGSTAHLAAALFAQQAGISITQVAYKGTAPAMADVMAGVTDCIFDGGNTTLPLLGASSRLKAIGVASVHTLPQFPGVVALGKDLVPGFEISTWYGLYAPKGTSSEIIQKLYTAYTKVMADSKFTAKLSADGVLLLPNDQYAPTALQAYTVSEVERWRKIFKEAKISVE